MTTKRERLPAIPMESKAAKLIHALHTSKPKLAGKAKAAATNPQPATGRMYRDAHYAGPGSIRFWSRIKKLREPDHSTLYSAGVILQDVEHRILSWLVNAEMRTGTKGDPL